jgi:hypothetical protein
MEQPELWETYVRGETQYNAINPGIGQWIRTTSHRLFPNQTYDQLTDLVLRLRGIVRQEIGLE